MKIKMNLNKYSTTLFELFKVIQVTYWGLQKNNQMVMVTIRCENKVFESLKRGLFRAVMSILVLN